jgi:hypothetical protein
VRGPTSGSTPSATVPAPSIGRSRAAPGRRESCTSDSEGGPEDPTCQRRQAGALRSDPTSSMRRTLEGRQHRRRVHEGDLGCGARPLHHRRSTSSTSSNGWWSPIVPPSTCGWTTVSSSCRGRSGTGAGSPAPGPSTSNRAVPERARSSSSSTVEPATSFQHRGVDDARRSSSRCRSLDDGVQDLEVPLVAPNKRRRLKSPGVPGDCDVAWVSRSWFAGIVMLWRGPFQRVIHLAVRAGRRRRRRDA